MTHMGMEWQKGIEKIAVKTEVSNQLPTEILVVFLSHWLLLAGELINKVWLPFLGYLNAIINNNGLRGMSWVSRHCPASATNTLHRH
jgi:hypothetical protein